MITRQQIDLLKDVIVQTMHPQKIYLFGSYANGTVNKDSDVDILIEVENSELPSAKRSIAIRKKMSEYKMLHFPKDVIIYTTAEINKWKDIKNSFAYLALKTSTTLYERK